MNIVIDSNVLFSALIRDSLTRKLLLEYRGFFLFPLFIFEEMEKHKAELMKKSGMSREEFNQLLKLILQKVLAVPNEILHPYRKESLEIVRKIDSDDQIFIACALAYPGSILWSDDKKLKKQSKVKVLSTSQIKEKLA
ncbi:PIN domain-containing protein [Candidatus Woesearchaeota archaeon]|nr:PIN domain-containing protein [Candidatus Woesearchaeota archaeon]